MSLPVDKIINTAFSAPACPTIHPDLRKTITPKMFIRHEVKTPSQVPNNTGCERKKFDFHQGADVLNVKFSTCKYVMLNELLVQLNYLFNSTESKNLMIIIFNSFK